VSTKWGKIQSVSYPYNGSIRTKALDHWKDQSQQIALIMSRLEQEFRIMLGSESEKNTGLEKVSDSGKVAKD